MKTADVRQKYLDFFKDSPRNHQLIDPAPLVLENDPTTLFTSSGMQPLVPYLLGEKHPKGKRLVNSQPAIRTQDIEEVGDNRHTTFFEMLGNWSLGDYFKEEQLPWIYEFLTKELGLHKENLWFSVFEGDKEFGIPEDKESVAIWKKIGIPEKRIVPYGVKKNWWSRTGTPSQMPTGDIGGPTSEIFYEFTQVKHDPKYGKVCHPNCDCGRFLEIGNNVFMEYKKINEKEIEPLPNKNIDFGGGLERLVAAVNNDPDIFKIDIFSELITVLEKLLEKNYEDNKADFRIIVEHMRGATYLAASKVIPSNKKQGYIMRRLVRRAVLKAQNLNDSKLSDNFFSKLVSKVINLDEGEYIDKQKTQELQGIISDEVKRFNMTLQKGQKELKKLQNLDASSVFDLYQSYGFPVELTLEIAASEDIKVEENMLDKLEKEIEKHKEKSRTTSKGMFKGGLADHSQEVVRLHTTAHLLHAALRDVLGEEVLQKGQNITQDRLRFDVSYGQKLTEQQLKMVENLINQKIDQNLPVKQQMMKRSEAEKSGAIGLFADKYSDEVSVYYVGEDLDKAFSKEFCGGPHVANTKKIGHVRIKKQEKIGSNLLRIYTVFGN